MTGTALHPPDGSVHVVGAGFAGAAAAVTLAQAGHRVVLWEARATVGGRASSFIDRETGEELDNGPHLLMGAYRRTRALLDTLGTADRLRFQPAMRLPLYVDGTPTEVRCPELPGPWFLLLGLLGMTALSWPERLAMVVAGHALKKPVAAGQSVAQWLERIRMPRRSVTLLWAPLCRAIMNLEPKEACAATLVAALGEALTRSADDARLAWVEAGLGGLLHPALAGLMAAHNGIIRHQRVVGVQLDDHGRVAGLLARSGEKVAASAVVLATDPEQACRLLPAAARPLSERLIRLGGAPVISVYLWLDRPVIPFGKRPFIGLVGGRAEWLFDRDRSMRPSLEKAADSTEPGRTGQRLAAVISAGDDLSTLPEGQVVARVLDDIAVHFPAVRQAEVVRFRVVKVRRATIRITPDTVRPQAGPVAGVPGLYLCGDYTDTGLPATIEGAVRSGEAAARAVLVEGGLAGQV